MAIDKNLTEKINEIIFDTLARRGSVYIDGIGSLKPTVVTANAEINGSTVSFPFYRIILDKNATTGIDLKSQILSINGINKGNLDVIFFEWLNECGFRNNSTDYHIEGVLTSEKGNITVSERLNGYLNPVPEIKSTAGPKKAAKNKTRVVVIVLLVICAALVGMTIYSNLSGKMNFMSWLVTSSNQEPKEKKITPVTVEEEKFEKEEIKKIKEEKREQKTVNTVSEPETEKINSGLVSTDTSKEMYYIVAGTFKKMDNAEKFVNSISARYNKAQIHTFGRRHFVTIDGFHTREEALQANKKYFRNLQSWILHIKDNKIIE